jgi:hypothetical protein
MWSNSVQGSCEVLSRAYTEGRGTTIPGTDRKLPLMKDNLEILFSIIQVGLDVLSGTFMWNFAGRQNDLQGSTPGDVLRGNWESGIGIP